MCHVWSTILLLELLFSSSAQELPLCDGLSYNDGMWIESYQNSTAENFECCSNTLDGEQYNSLDCRKTPAPPLVEDHGCLCKDYFYAEKRTSFSSDPYNFRPRAIDYKWKPHNCVLLDWDAKRFCDILGDRKILMVGDSTMSQTHKTLQNMIYFAFMNETSCQTNILWNHGDRLVRRYRLGHSASIGRGNTILEAGQLRNYNFDFLVVAAGFHIHPPLEDTYLNITDGSYADFFFPILRNEINHLRVKNPNLKVIYKTENFGHNGCGLYEGKGPDNALNNYSALQKMNALNKYHWDREMSTEDRFIDFAHWNDVSILRMHPLYSRPDGHPGGSDCLHYCAPGPLNIFSRLLLHYLVVGEEKWRTGENYRVQPTRKRR
jgi:hypothetical protein